MIVTILLTLLIYSTVNAATYYVRSGATGNGSGSDWTNAYTTLPSRLDRGVNGSTYYIADGNYEGYHFSTTSAPVDGTKIITIKKATSIDHGTNTGWISAYGDGQAVFQWSDHGTTNYNYKLDTFRIATSYITIDGSVGSGGNINDYGFKCVIADGFGDAGFTLWSAVSIGSLADRNKIISNIIVKHVASNGPSETQWHRCFDGNDGWTCSNNGLQSYIIDPGLLSNLTVENCLFGYWNNNISIRGANNVVLKGNYLNNNISSATGLHGQNINVDSCNGFTITNNHIVSSKEFAVALHSQGTGTVSNLKIYNNLFYGTNPSMSGFISTMTSDVDTIATGMQVHHNTIVGQNCGGKGFVRVGTITDSGVVSYVYNNLFYKTTNCSTSNTGYTGGVIVHDYNAYISSTGYTAEANGIVSAQDPFVDSLNSDYHPKVGAIVNCKGLNLYKKLNLPQDFIFDMDGKYRGNTFWAIGAYRAAGPAPPENITINQ